MRHKKIDYHISTNLNIAKYIIYHLFNKITITKIFESIGLCDFTILKASLGMGMKVFL